jgi:hypothetical protein
MNEDIKDSLEDSGEELKTTADRATVIEALKSRKSIPVETGERYTKAVESLPETESETSAETAKLIQTFSSASHKLVAVVSEGDLTKQARTNPFETVVGGSTETITELTDVMSHNLELLGEDYVSEERKEAIRKTIEKANTRIEAFALLVDMLDEAVTDPKERPFGIEVKSGFTRRATKSAKEKSLLSADERSMDDYLDEKYHGHTFPGEEVHEVLQAAMYALEIEHPHVAGDPESLSRLLKYTDMDFITGKFGELSADPSGEIRIPFIMDTSLVLRKELRDSKAVAVLTIESNIPSEVREKGKNDHLRNLKLKNLLDIDPPVEPVDYSL